MTGLKIGKPLTLKGCRDYCIAVGHARISEKNDNNICTPLPSTVTSMILNEQYRVGKSVYPIICLSHNLTY